MQMDAEEIRDLLWDLEDRCDHLSARELIQLLLPFLHQEDQGYWDVALLKDRIAMKAWR